MSNLFFFDTFVILNGTNISAAFRHISEASLVTLLKKKDRGAFDYLYDQYAGALLGVIGRIITRETIAEELLQDVFLKIWDRIETYDASKGKLFTWMLNIARNHAIDKIRSKEFSKAKKTCDIENYVDRIDRGESVEQSVEAIGLHELLNALPDDQRFIIDLHYLKGYTQSEISEEFNLPLGTVKTRMRLAMKELRNLLIPK